ncbi:ABC transporter ATP-binding protein [Bacteroidota bacterium]
MNKFKMLLTPRELRHLWLMTGLLFVKAILQVIGIVSILPFMALVANPNLVHTNKWINKFYVFGGFSDEHSALVAAGIAMLIYMALSNAFVAFVGWVQIKFTSGISHRMGVRMARSYIGEPYEFFLTRSAINLLKRVVQEVAVFVRQILIPALEVVSKGLVSIIIFLMLVLVDAQLAGTVFLVLGGSYVMIYLFKQNLLRSLGEERLDQNRERFKSVSDLMSGIKEIQLYNARAYFFERFTNSSAHLASIVPRIHLVTTAPRYLVETLAYGGILIVTLYLLEYAGSIEDLIPVLSLYAVAGYRLIPSLQSTFEAIAVIRHSWPVVDELILDYNRPISPVGLGQRKPVKKLPFEDTISFRNVSFTYGSEQVPALKPMNFDLKCGSNIAFVGRTGSGKTTLVDVLTGLLLPSSGEILIDGTVLDATTKVNWQQQIGYVTQELFLFDDTVMRNIAFGVPDDKIDEDRVIEAARIAQAHDFIVDSLPKGYNTVVGDRAVRLSGGQRVRLGLARALYRKPSVLVLDEATSALDGITERAIIEELVESPAEFTLILIAHRMSSVRSCDSIFLLEDGYLKDAGTFDELMKTSDVFSEMQDLTS